MENLSDYILLILSFILGLLINTIVSSYLKNKGKNFATKQDITKITEQVESVKTEYRKKIDDYKQELNVKMENLRFEQNQLMTNFELYTAMRHECYPELYKLIEISNGSIRSLRGLTRELTYENADKRDIEFFMRDKQFTSKDIERVLKEWDENKKTAIILLQKNLERINYNEAEEKFIDANNYFYFMNIYLSDDVEKVARELLNMFHELWINYEPESVYKQTKSNEKSSKNEEIISRIESLKQKLKLTMRQELMPNLK